MKILKIFGIVVGIHVFALVLIFANPGCSSTTKPAPSPAQTVTKAEPAPMVTVPIASAAPIAFNPDAPASAGGVRFNPTRPNTPVAQTLVAEPVKDVTPMTTYTVKSGDSLWSIANKNKLSYQDLAAANELKSNAALQPGQKLVIPGKPMARPTASAGASAAPAPAGKSADAQPSKSSGAGMRHTVKSGESLGAIAQKYGIRQRDLAIANNITDPLKLPAGKELIIPGWDAANGKPPVKGSAKSPAPSTATKPAAENRPVFTTPQLDQPAPVIGVGPSAPVTGDVPVIRVEESSAPKKP
jgi:LysM repeat protein